MYTTPTSAMTTPTGVSSNIPSGGIPNFSSIPDAATLVDVPISVHVPPSSDAYATGIRNFEVESLRRRATPIVGGTKIAVTAVLFIHADAKAIVDVRPRRMPCGLLPRSRCTALPAASAAPVRTSAPEMTKIPMRSRVMELVKPERISVGVRMLEA
jgi:hypothetical protein